MLEWLTQINSLLIWQLWLRCMYVYARKRVCRLEGGGGGFNGTLLPLVKVTLAVSEPRRRCKCIYDRGRVCGHMCWTRYHHISCAWVLSWRKTVCWDAGIAWTAFFHFPLSGSPSCRTNSTFSHIPLRRWEHCQGYLIRLSSGSL